MQEQFCEIKIKYFYETSHVFPKKSCVRGWLKEEMFVCVCVCVCMCVCVCVDEACQKRIALNDS